MFCDFHFIVILERLRLPLPVTEARCDCGALTELGRLPTLRTTSLHPRRLARICRELRDMNVAVRADDERCIEVAVPRHLAVDITLRCSGDARPGAACVDGIVCTNARAHKEQKCSELLAEIGAGSSWLFWRPEGDGSEALEFVEGLELARGRPHPTKPSWPSWHGGGDGFGCSPSLCKSVHHLFAVWAKGVACPQSKIRNVVMCSHAVWRALHTPCLMQSVPALVGTDAEHKLPTTFPN